MGTHYTIQLYFPIGRLGCAIKLLNELVYPDKSNVSTQLLLPDQHSVEVLHRFVEYPESIKPTRTYGDQLGQKRSLSVPDRVFFFATLGFEIDDVIKQHIHRESQFSTRPREEVTEAPVFGLGQLLVSIETGERYADVSLNVPVHSQNDVMQRSTSVHTAMLRIIDSCDGVAALLDMEKGDEDTYSLFLLNDQKRVITINRMASRDLTDIDSVVKIIKKHLSSGDR